MWEEYLVNLDSVRDGFGELTEMVWMEMSEKDKSFSSKQTVQFLNQQLDLLKESVSLLGQAVQNHSLRLEFNPERKNHESPIIGFKNQVWRRAPGNGWEIVQLKRQQAITVPEEDPIDLTNSD